MVSAILLAAGEAKRLGKLKQLLPLGETTILEQAIDNLLNSRIDELIVVVGYKAKEVMRKIATKPVKVAINPNYHQGMSTSVIAGLKLVNNKTQTVMLALGDQPFVESKTINLLIEEFSSHDKGIAVPVYRGRRGHPVIFATKYKEALLRLKGDVGGREIIKKHPDDILEVAVDSEGINIDVDTMNSYYRLSP